MLSFSEKQTIIKEDDRTQKLVGGVMAFLLMLSMLLLAKETADIKTASKSAVPGDGRLEVVIYAGHGAADSGKIGINKALEKDINLQIALKVKRLLEAQDIQVYMTREAKNNNSYYLLKKTETPIIIVECGFLSNRKEAKLLITEEYQEKAAWAIHLGILRYLNS